MDGYFWSTVSHVERRFAGRVIAAVLASAFACGVLSLTLSVLIPNMATAQPAATGARANRQHFADVGGRSSGNAPDDGGSTFFSQMLSGLLEQYAVVPTAEVSGHYVTLSTNGEELTLSELEDDGSLTPITRLPEAGTVALLATGLAGIGLFGRRRRRRPLR